MQVRAFMSKKPPVRGQSAYGFARRAGRGFESVGSILDNDTTDDRVRRIFFECTYDRPR